MEAAGAEVVGEGLGGVVDLAVLAEGVLAVAGPAAGGSDQAR